MYGTIEKILAINYFSQIIHMHLHNNEDNNEDNNAHINTEGTVIFLIYEEIINLYITTNATNKHVSTTTNSNTAVHCTNTSYNPHLVQTALDKAANGVITTYRIVL